MSKVITWLLKWAKKGSDVLPFRIVNFPGLEEHWM